MGIENKIKKDIPLAQHTTFEIGGLAKFFVEVKFAEELKDVLVWAKKHEEKIYILGGGSNVLISDKGIDGLVVKFINNDIANLTPRIHCGAGTPLVVLASFARNISLSGLEWSFGIPRATVGGSIRGNAGAFGQEISDIVETVEVYNTKKNRFEFFSKNDCQFAYRGSIFKENSDYIVWAATFKCIPKNLEEIRENIESNLKMRFEKQSRLPNAGSVFKNLFLDDIKKVNEKLYLYIRENNLGRSGKIGAGFVIDYCGLKGKKIGGAKTSLEHANFIVNTGKATCTDVLELIKLIKKDVERKTGIELEEEIQVVI